MKEGSTKVLSRMATSEVQTVSATGDKMRLALAGALVIAALVAYYMLAGKGSLAQWGGLLLGLVAAIVVFFTSESGRQLIAFGRDAVREVKKVVWPERKEAMQITAYVFAFVVVMALFLWLTDKTLEWVFYDLILGWKKIMNDAVVNAPMAGSSTNPDLKWYVVHAYSGMEKAVERNIIERIARSGMETKFGRILVPTEEVVEVKNGQKRTTERKFFPGYVLVEMVMDDETWHLVKHTNKVTGFVGGAKNRPAPISEADVQKIVSQMQEGTDKPRHKVEFEVGEYIRVKEGPFTDFNGTVEEVNYERNKMRVSVTIFGRATPVELEFGQVEKT